VKIAILGTRGIPNHYGGFEQFAEYLSIELVREGHQVIVYNSHNHPYQLNEWNGVDIIHIADPEDTIGTAGQFVYDLLCIVDARKRGFDVILQLGYTSSSIWGGLLPKSAIIVTNMDGLEWKRSKYSKPVQRFLLFAEKLGVKYSDHLVSDSIGIQKYILDKYNRASTYIAYGAHCITTFRKDTLHQYKLQPSKYSMLIARLEPENSIELILDGVVASGSDEPFMVIGNHKTKYGEYLKCKYASNDNIHFLGGIYDIKKLNDLRYYCKFYFHGHTVGGTNPSLLEAMASGAIICAHDNIFNRSILGDDSQYFTRISDISRILTKDVVDEQREKMRNSNFQKIKQLYSWEYITEQYIKLFNEAYQKSKC
jgi:glycosyltransferase involved in cell wall biosynthesis